MVDVICFVHVTQRLGDFMADCVDLILDFVESVHTSIGMAALLLVSLGLIPLCTRWFVQRLREATAYKGRDSP